MHDARILGGDWPAGFTMFVKENLMVTAQTIAGLYKALKAKKGQLAALQAKRAKAAMKLRKATAVLKIAAAAKDTAVAGVQALDSAIAALSGAKAPAKPAKKKPVAKKAAPKKKAAAPKKAAPKKAAAKTSAAPAGGLAGVLATVLAGKSGVSVGQATKLVLAAGYKTKSKQFQTIVNQTVLRDPRFVNVARGVYALKGEGKPAAPKAAPKQKAPAKKAAPKAKAPAKKAAAAGSLKSILLNILAGKEAVGIAEATAAVLATGYKTKAQKFSLIVNQMLAKNPAFKQVGRGKYAAK